MNTGVANLFYEKYKVFRSAEIKKDNGKFHRNKISLVIGYA